MMFWKKRKGKQEPVGTKPIAEPRLSEVEAPNNDNLSKLSSEARAKLEAESQKISEIVAFAKESPEDASSVIRAWLVPDDAK